MYDCPCSPIFSVVVVHLSVGLTFFAILGQTFLINYGLLDDAWRIFRHVWLLFCLHLLSLLAARVPRLVAAGSGTSWLEFWSSHFAKGAHVFHSLLAVVYYAVLMQTCFGMARTKFYKSEVFAARTLGVK
mmetsp:Transcript_9199/g.23185  ORF Transcript_9199/g.23185 Transcript_9199/m.23185 type:complete len:130 (-) Transcript_9199:12-401(-)